MADDRWLRAWRRVPVVLLPAILPWFLFTTFLRARLSGQRL